MPKKNKSQENPEIRKRIGRNLKEARVRKGYSATQAARLLDCNDSIIGRYENGERSPSISILFALAEVYGVNVKSFLDVHRTHKGYMTDSVLDELFELRKLKKNMQSLLK